MKEKKKSKFLIEGTILAKNKNLYKYEIIRKFTAGLVLTGTEVKSLVKGGADISQSFITFRRHEAFLTNSNIAQLQLVSRENHDPGRSRKLLLKKSELSYLNGRMSEKGYVTIPVILVRKHRVFKLEIALAKGLKKHDQRERIKKREQERESKYKIEY